MNYNFSFNTTARIFKRLASAGKSAHRAGELERALSLIENAEVKVAGSGRTDAGVHAEGQVASVQISRKFTSDKLRSAINGNVWRDLRILNAEKAPDDFHARIFRQRQNLRLPHDQRARHLSVLAALRPSRSKTARCRQNE